MHSAFVGMSRSGKSTLAQVTAAGLVRMGRRVGVFDPLRDPNWDKTGAELVTADPFELLHACKTQRTEKRGRSWHWFWEEWGPYLKRHPDPSVRKLTPAFAWLGASSRQLGHSQWFIAHCWQDLIDVRGQMDQVFAFAQGHKSAALVAEDFARPELMQSLPRLSRGKFKLVSKMADNIRDGSIDFARRKMRWAKS